MADGKIKGAFKRVFPGGGMTPGVDQRPTTAEHLLNVGTAGILGRNRTAFNNLERIDTGEQRTMDRQVDQKSKLNKVELQTEQDRFLQEQARTADLLRGIGISDSEIASRVAEIGVGDRLNKAIGTQAERPKVAAAAQARQAADMAGSREKQAGSVRQATADEALTGILNDPNVIEGQRQAQNSRLRKVAEAGTLPYLLAGARNQAEGRAAIQPWEFTTAERNNLERSRFMPIPATGGLMDIANRELLSLPRQQQDNSYTRVQVGTDIDGNPKYEYIRTRPENIYNAPGVTEAPGKGKLKFTAEDFRNALNPQ